MSIEIDEITKKFTRQEFIDAVIFAGCAKYNITTKNYCNGNVVKFSVCRECITESTKDIKFKDELEDVKMEEKECSYKEIQELRDIKNLYECQIAELKEKIESLESPICNCIVDPEEERKHYKSITDENIRLKNIIKLMTESL